MRLERLYRDVFFRTLVQLFEGSHRLFRFLARHPIRRTLMWDYCVENYRQGILAERAAFKWFQLYALFQLRSEGRESRDNASK